MPFRALECHRCQRKQVIGTVNMERKVCSFPQEGTGRRRGSREFFIEGIILELSFWLRVSVQKAEGGQGHPGVCLGRVKQPVLELGTTHYGWGCRI